MTPAIRDLFRELADLSAVERERIFAERQVPPAIREEVLCLLTFDQKGGQQLTVGVAAALADEMGTAASFQAGGDCGPYHLIRLLGRGGMGAVFLGERMDGEIEQRVAMKKCCGPARIGPRSGSGSYKNAKS